MRVTALAFDDDQEPEHVTVVMTIAEAAHITHYLGGQPGGNATTSAIHGALAGMVFNPYWEDGLDGYLRKHS